MRLTDRLTRISDEVLSLCGKPEDGQVIPAGKRLNLEEELGRAGTGRILGSPCAYDRETGKQADHPLCGSYGGLSIYLMLYALSGCGWNSAMEALHPDLYERACRNSRLQRKVAKYMDFSSDHDDWEYHERISRAEPGKVRIPAEPDPDQTRYEKMADWIDFRRTRDWYEGNPDPE